MRPEQFGSMLNPTETRTAIQRCFDAAAARPGAVIDLAPREYVVDGKVWLAASRVTLRGNKGRLKLADGANSITLLVTGNPWPDSAHILRDVSIEGLEIDGNHAGQTARGTGPFEADFDNCGLLALGTERLRVRDCYVHDVRGHGIAVDRSRWAVVAGNTVERAGQQTTSGGRNGISLYAPFPGGTSQPSGGQGIVAHNIVRFCTDVGIDCAGNGSDGWIIQGNQVYGGPTDLEGSDGCGIALEIHAGESWPNGRSVVQGNVVQGYRDGITANSDGQVNHAISIVGNVLSDLLGTGIQVVGRHIVVSANVIERYGLGPWMADGIACALNSALEHRLEALTISNNSIWTDTPDNTTSKSGVRVSMWGLLDRLDGLVIAANQLRGPGHSSGIRIDPITPAQTRGVIVAHNIIRRYGGPFDVGGLNTVIEKLIGDNVIYDCPPL